jgi:hypothetical protein
MFFLASLFKPRLGRFYRCIILIGKPEGKTSIGRPRYRREDNTRRHLKGGVGCRQDSAGSI